jgi:hypothetical protein
MFDYTISTNCHTLITVTVFNQNYNFDYSGQLFFEKIPVNPKAQSSLYNIYEAWRFRSRRYSDQILSNWPEFSNNKEFFL